MTVHEFPGVKAPKVRPTLPRIVRSERLHVTLSEEELAWLGRIAELKGISRSDCLRLLIRREHYRGGAP
jgi:hypothetical protein